MELDRTLLLGAAEAVKPALALKETYEEMQHIWSDGATLTAYNDTSLGIQVPFASEIKGGMRGSILLGVLAKSRAKKVDITVTDSEAVLQAGRTRLKLALLPADRALWAFPALGKAKGVPLPPAFVAALKAVLISAGSGTTAPEQLGVTLAGGKDGQVHMFATDSETIAWQTTPKPAGWFDERVILPTPFVEQVVRLADDKTTLQITTDSAIAVTGAGVKIFARIVDSPKPLDFEKIVREQMGQSDAVPIPEGMKLVLERAAVMLGGQKNEFMEVEVEDGRMRIFAKTPSGDMRDSIKLGKAIPARKCKVKPALLKRALPLATTLGFGGKTVVMTGDHFVYVAAVAGD